MAGRKDALEARFTVRNIQLLWLASAGKPVR
jgi:hypothetical protein